MLGGNWDDVLYGSDEGTGKEYIWGDIGDTYDFKLDTLKYFEEGKYGLPDSWLLSSGDDVIYGGDERTADSKLYGGGGNDKIFAGSKVTGDVFIYGDHLRLGERD